MLASPCCSMNRPVMLLLPDLCPGYSLSQEGFFQTSTHSFPHLPQSLLRRRLLFEAIPICSHKHLSMACLPKLGRKLPRAGRFVQSIHYYLPNSSNTALRVLTAGWMTAFSTGSGNAHFVDCRKEGEKPGHPLVAVTVVQVWDDSSSVSDAEKWPGWECILEELTRLGDRLAVGRWHRSRGGSGLCPEHRVDSGAIIHDEENWRKGWILFIIHLLEEV